jgi:hypothetical protein
MNTYTFHFEEAGLTCSNLDTSTNVTQSRDGSLATTGEAYIEGLFDAVEKALFQASDYGLTSDQIASLNLLRTTLLDRATVHQRSISEAGATPLDAAFAEMLVGHRLVADADDDGAWTDTDEELEATSQKTFLKSSQDETVNMEQLVSKYRSSKAPSADFAPDNEATAAQKLSTLVTQSWYPICPLNDSHILRVASALQDQISSVDQKDWIRFGGYCAVIDQDSSIVAWYSHRGFKQSG